MSKDKLLEQLESGRIGTEEQIKEQEDKISFHEETLKVQDELFEAKKAINILAADKPKIIKPEFEFHNNDEYWALESKIRLLNFKIEELNHKIRREGLVKTIEQQKKELQRLKGE